MLSRLKPNYRLKANEPERPLIGRLALHAAALSLPHPATGNPVTIVSPWPKDLSVAIKYLRRFASQNIPSAVSEQLDEFDSDRQSSEQ